MEIAVQAAPRLLTLVIALSIHEWAHAYSAYVLGDQTAARMGRLTLNPLAHLEWLGTLMILFAPVGWAKPVPVNPLNLRNPKTSMTLVAFAGPLSNLVLAFAGCCVLYASWIWYPPSYGVSLLLQTFISINLILAFFNLIPISPLDGSKIISVFMPDEMADRYHFALQKMGFFPLLILIAMEYLLQPFGPLSLWFKLWNPLVNPVLNMFSLPLGLYPGNY